MKKYPFSISVIVILVILTLGGSLPNAQGLEIKSNRPEQAAAHMAAVEQKISYQGMLTENGTPVTGSRTMVFRLYSDSGCSSQVGSDINAGSVQVTDGLFDVDLPVDQDDFDGQGLWLRTVVGGTAIGCEEILPVPYALSLRPGATIKGAPGLAGSLVEASTQDGSIKGSLVQGLLLTGAGLYGSTSSSLAYGVYGSNSAGGYAGYFDSDVGQSRTGDGLVKAAVYAYCADSGSSITRYFNNVNSNSITIISGPSAGRCTIDFNFTINDRFWSASSYGLVAQGVSCQQGTSTDRLDCYRWSTAPTGVDGSIMVVVY
jgi:hypothetical protein